MQVVLLSTDLMVVSRVQDAAARSAASVRVAVDVPALVNLHGHVPADFVIVDLASSPLAIDTLVSQLKADAEPPTRIVAFGPHVHEERLAAARAAGCDLVMARGQFFSQVESLLAAERQPEQHVLGQCMAGYRWSIRRDFWNTGRAILGERRQAVLFGLIDIHLAHLHSVDVAPQQQVNTDGRYPEKSSAWLPCACARSPHAGISTWTM